MVLNSLIKFTCNILRFEPNYIPSKRNIFDIFGSNAFESFQKALWPIGFSEREKKVTSQILAQELNILTPTDKLLNLGVLSVGYRLATIVTTSAKLYIDNYKLKKEYSFQLPIGYKLKVTDSLVKNVASAAVSALPITFLYFMGCPISDLMLNQVMTQTMASIAPIISLKASNYLRQLDLISHDKLFNVGNYASRLLTITGIDIIVGTLWRGKELLLNPYQDPYPMLKYCALDNAGRGINSNTMLLSSVTYIEPLVSFADKLVWNMGRSLTDASLVMANKFGFIKDIRSPFINNFRDIIPIFKEVKIKNEVAAPVQRNQRHNVSSSSSSVNNSSVSLTEVKQPEKYIRPEVKAKEKRKGQINEEHQARLAEAQLEQNLENEPKIVTTFKFKSHTFYRLHGERVPENTWGVLISNNIRSNEEIFERSLRTGHVGNIHSTIKYLPNLGLYEARPSSIGDRVLGRMQRGFNGLTSLFSLSEVMEVYGQLKSANGPELHLITFDTQRKHEAVGKVR